MGSNITVRYFVVARVGLKQRPSSSYIYWAIARDQVYFGTVLNEEDHHEGFCKCFILLVQMIIDSVADYRLF